VQMESEGYVLVGQDIICVLPTAWDGPWGTHQQVVSRLAESNRALVLELPVSPLSPFSGSHKGTWMRQLHRWQQGMRQADKPQLTILAPPPVFPLRYHKLSNYLTQVILMRCLESAQRRLGYKDPLVITFQTDSGVLVRKINARAKIYYCIDDTSAFGGWRQPAQKVRQREAELVETCDLVFAASRRLTSRLEKLGTPAYFNPNGADFRLFSQSRVMDPPTEIQSLKHPVIGFVGMISAHSFDDDLVYWLANRHPDWSFVIAGKKSGRDPDLRQFERLPNVRFVGFQALEMLPKYLAGMDVCLIPRRGTEWVKSAFSVKLFEYLAAGKPVVATWTEEFVPYQELVYLPRDYAEFEQAITNALSEDSPELVCQRMQLARENTWDQRVERFSEVVQAYLDGRRGPANSRATEASRGPGFDERMVKVNK
jgi:glycosyltransferase involved in cell wall biosynthesis